jgi:uncharacterized protein YeaO (DUF488 family)
MAVRIVRLGSPRVRGEGLRLGTVRRPPRGVPKTDYAARDWYDVWLPNLAPADATVKLALGASTPAEWRRFVRRYRAEMATPDNRHLLDLLAALSHHTNFSVGCYCADPARCHRSTLRELLEEHGAEVLEEDAPARR